MSAKKSWMLTLSTAVFLVAGVCAVAQTATTIQKNVKMEGQSGETSMMYTFITSGEPQTHISTYSFVASEMGFESKVVRGVPFSADTSTEFTQVLGNGQRLHRSSTDALYRDGEGRIRREQTIGAIKGYASAGSAPKTIFINDPVAGVSYIINPMEHSVFKTSSQVLPGSPGAGMIVHGVNGGESGHFHVSTGEVTAQSGTMPHTVVTGTGGPATIAHSHNSRTEPLGRQMIEGVWAEGTRTVDTIPAGDIGNEMPIEIVSERWYSEELGLVVKTVRNDPLSGNNVYQLKNIRRGEPSPDLFQVPAGFSIKESAIKFKTPKKE